MTWRSTRVGISSAALQLAGGGSTIINTAFASQYDAVHACVQVLVNARWYLAPTSAGTTANGFRVNGFQAFHIDLIDTSQLWGYTSAAATTVGVILTAGLQ